MAKSTFEIAEEPSTDLVVIAEKQVAVATSVDASAKGLIGEWTNEDVKLPRISLVSKTGELANNFAVGTWVLDKTHQLTKLEDRTKGSALTAIALRMLKQYKENIPYEEQTAGTIARTFNTADEVRDNGGTISRSQRGANAYSEIAHIEFLIQAPEELDEDARTLFYLYAGGKMYTRVIYTASGTAYGATAVTLATAIRNGHLGSVGLQGGFWQLGTALQSTTKNSWWIPTIKAAGYVDPETAAVIATLV